MKPKYAVYALAYVLMIALVECGSKQKGPTEEPTKDDVDGGKKKQKNEPIADNLGLKRQKAKAGNGGRHYNEPIRRYQEVRKPAYTISEEVMRSKDRFVFMRNNPVKDWDHSECNTLPAADLIFLQLEKGLLN